MISIRNEISKVETALNKKLEEISASKEISWLDVQEMEKTTKEILILQGQCCDVSW